MIEGGLKKESCNDTIKPSIFFVIFPYALNFHNGYWKIKGKKLFVSLIFTIVVNNAFSMIKILTFWYTLNEWLEIVVNNHVPLDMISWTISTSFTQLISTCCAGSFQTINLEAMCTQCQEEYIISGRLIYFMLKRRAKLTARKIHPRQIWKLINTFLGFIILLTIGSWNSRQVLVGVHLYSEINFSSTSANEA